MKKQWTSPRFSATNSLLSWKWQNLGRRMTSLESYPSIWPIHAKIRLMFNAP